MNRGKLMTKAIPLLIGSGLFLSACAVESDDGAPAYAYDYPAYGSLDFDYDGGWGGGWDHGHGFHDGHGFGGHGGGGHGGGGHR